MRKQYMIGVVGLFLAGSLQAQNIADVLQSIAELGTARNGIDFASYTVRYITLLSSSMGFAK